MVCYCLVNTDIGFPKEGCRLEILCSSCAKLLRSYLAFKLKYLKFLSAMNEGQDIYIEAISMRYKNHDFMLVLAIQYVTINKKMCMTNRLRTW